MRTSPYCKKNQFAILNEHSHFYLAHRFTAGEANKMLENLSTENLGIGRQWLHAIAFLYPACYITDHGIQVTHPSAALSEVECQPLKSACCRTLLAPGANLVAHAGVPWAGSQESVPRHTHAVKSGSVAFPHGLVLHLETRPKNSCWAPALKYFQQQFVEMLLFQ